jgi:hypothetical protein
VVSKAQITAEGKAQADEKAQHTLVCEHFEEVCDAPYLKIQMLNPAGQRSYRALDGV